MSWSFDTINKGLIVGTTNIVVEYLPYFLENRVTVRRGRWLVAATATADQKCDQLKVGHGARAGTIAGGGRRCRTGAEFATTFATFSIWFQIFFAKLPFLPFLLFLFRALLLVVDTEDVFLIRNGYFGWLLRSLLFFIHFRLPVWNVDNGHPGIIVVNLSLVNNTFTFVLH